MVIKKQKAFTLIELLVVIAIISLISSIVFVALGGARDKAKRARALQFAASVHHGLGAEAVGIWDFDEGSGTTAKDYSGYNNNGTINGATWSALGDTPSGKGYALSFDGGNDYVSVPDASSLNPTTALTMAAWIKSTGNGENDGRIISKRKDLDNAAYEMMLITATGKIQVYILTPNGGTSVTGNISVQDGKFHHICVTRQDSVLKIYTDGVLDTTAGVSTGSVANTQNLYIGRYSLSAIRFFNGLIDDVRIYSEALSSTQIQKLYVEGTRERGLLADN